MGDLFRKIERKRYIMWSTTTTTTKNDDDDGPQSKIRGSIWFCVFENRGF